LLLVVVLLLLVVALLLFHTSFGFLDDSYNNPAYSSMRCCNRRFFAKFGMKMAATT
jgi:hypothetical protein